MPCRYDDSVDDGRGVAIELKKCREELDKVTRLLCEAMEKLLAPDPRPDLISVELEKWWENHKRQDETRRKREEEQKQAAIRLAEAEMKKAAATIAAKKKLIAELKKGK